MLDQMSTFLHAPLNTSKCLGHVYKLVEINERNVYAYSLLITESPFKVELFL